MAVYEFATELTGGYSDFDVNAVANGSEESLGAPIGAPDSFDGPAGSWIQVLDLA